MKYSAQEITAQLGGHWLGRYGVARCPVHDDKTASLKISVKVSAKGERLDCHCFAGCDWKDVKAELVKRGLIEPWRPETEPTLSMRHRVTKQALAAGKIAKLTMHKKAAANTKEEDRKRVAFAIKLWDQSVPLEGTLGGTYLRVVRGLNFVDGMFDHCLRWHAGKGMIVGLLTGARSRQPCGVQRIFLDELGRKVTRKMFGKAGVCRLSDDSDVTQGLTIVEGIEDGIATICEGVKPVWSCMSAGAIADFPVLGGVEALTILADGDDKGQEAAAKCAERWIKQDREVRILRYEPRPA